jgi:hypothetical protein
MAQSRTIDILNRLYMLHHRSLPAYLHYAPPDRVRNHPEAREVLAQIVTDQAATADKFATMVLESGGTVIPGEFPMWFTGLHDLSVEYLVGQLIERQGKFIAACEGLADQLALAPYAQAAAREAIGEAKGHLDNLKELTGAEAAAL